MFSERIGFEAAQHGGDPGFAEHVAVDRVRVYGRLAIGQELQRADAVAASDRQERKGLCAIGPELSSKSLAHLVGVGQEVFEDMADRSAETDFPRERE